MSIRINSCSVATLLSLLAIFNPTQTYAADSPWSLHNALDAPSSLTLSGSIRTRYETLSGQSRTGISANDDLISLRNTLFGEYNFGSLRLGAELYDSRAYGGDDAGSVSANDVNALELVQAYAAFDLTTPFGADTKASLQAGRFVLNLGSRRLVDEDDYRNTTNANTGLRVDFSMPNAFSATLIYVLPQIRLPRINLRCSTTLSCSIMRASTWFFGVAT